MKPYSIQQTTALWILTFLPHLKRFYSSQILNRDNAMENYSSFQIILWNFGHSYLQRNKYISNDRIKPQLLKIKLAGHLFRNEVVDLET